VATQVCKSSDHQLMVFIRQEARIVGTHAANSEKREVYTAVANAVIRQFCHKNRALRLGERR
jgi:hypothetical protein